MFYLVFYIVFVSFNHINVTQEIFTIIILLFIISLKHSPHSRHFGKRESEATFRRDWSVSCSVIIIYNKEIHLKNTHHSKLHRLKVKVRHERKGHLVFSDIQVTLSNKKKRKIFF